MNGTGRYIPPDPRLAGGGMAGWVRALLALLLVAAIGFGVVEVQKRKQRQEALADLDKAHDEIQSDIRRQMDKDGILSPEKGVEVLKRYRSEFEKTAAAGGEQGKAMKAIADILADVQRRSDPYMKLAQQMEKQSPFDLVSVKERAELARRQDLGKEMLRLNQDLVTMFTGLEQQLRNGLGRADIQSAEAKAILDGFARGYSGTIPIQRRIRACDKEIGQGLVEMCDLLDAEWGRWSVKEGVPTFETDATAEKYNAIIERVQKAAEDQGQAQREMLKHKY